MNDKDVLRYLELLDRKLSIATSGIHWKPEYEEELLKLRELIDQEHRKRMKREEGRKEKRNGKRDVHGPGVPKYKISSVKLMNGLYHVQSVLSKGRCRIS